MEAERLSNLLAIAESQNHKLRNKNTELQEQNSRLLADNKQLKTTIHEILLERDNASKREV